ncbi:MAG: FixH family protein [Rhodospirillales bacterium]|nr:FixH family protein [Rhodospirillales bacterium]
MMTTAAQATNNRKPGWWYPWIFVGGMTIVVVVNGIMIYFALSTFTGLETKNYYEKGLAYNTNIEAARLQAAMGWQASVAYLPSSDATVATPEAREGLLEVTFRDRGSNPISGLKVDAKILRPTIEGFDQEVTFAERGEGRYGVVLKLPQAGQWEVRVVARGGEMPYQHSQRIVIP